MGPKTKQEFILDHSQFALTLLKTIYGIDLEKYSVNEINDILNLISTAMWARKEMSEFLKKT